MPEDDDLHELAELLAPPADQSPAERERTQSEALDAFTAKFQRIRDDIIESIAEIGRLAAEAREADEAEDTDLRDSSAFRIDEPLE